MTNDSLGTKKPGRTLSRVWVLVKFFNAAESDHFNHKVKDGCKQESAADNAFDCSEGPGFTDHAVQPQYDNEAVNKRQCRCACVMYWSLYLAQVYG